MDERMRKLAEMICNYSLNLQPQEKLYISYGSIACQELVKELVKIASRKGAFVYMELNDLELEALRKREIKEENISMITELEEAKIAYFDAFVYLKYSINDYELKTLDDQKRQKLNKAVEHSINVRANEKKWVLLNYPSLLDAYKNKRSIEEYYNYALDAMTIDYEELSHKIQPLKELMEKTKMVHIVSPGTDLTFSIENMPAVPCLGEKNIPDGELYTAPVKNSVNGTITYNTPSPYHGNIYHHVKLVFQDGQIIEATSDEGDLFHTIFATDEGARYVGEFSLGFNPKILEPMEDILYDEKIYGSLHFTPGSCYDDCNNGNQSAIHWDLVLIQTKEYGGGEIYFDDILIRQDGEFVKEELQKLKKNQ